MFMKSLIVLQNVDSYFSQYLGVLIFAGPKCFGQASPLSDMLHQCPSSPAADRPATQSNVWRIQSASSGLQRDE